LKPTRQTAKAFAYGKGTELLMQTLEHRKCKSRKPDQKTGDQNAEQETQRLRARPQLWQRYAKLPTHSCSASKSF
jgi:hypothetical protein